MHNNKKTRETTGITTPAIFVEKIWNSGSYIHFFECSRKYQEQLVRCDPSCYYLVEQLFVRSMFHSNWHCIRTSL